MNCNIIFISAVFLVLMHSPMIFSQNTESYDINPFTHFGKNMSGSFSGTNVLLHSAAIVSTVLIIQSDADYFVHDYFLSEYSNLR